MFTCFLDAVAHGGDPQDRAASLIQKHRLRYAHAGQTVACP
ncbi:MULTISPECIES: hypothetical protein [unclassified Moorena]|nr:MULTISPECIES: hypothetical protein [unclassified Moorena]